MGCAPAIDREGLIHSLTGYLDGRDDDGSLGLVLIDIPNLGQVNRRHGVEAGDGMLQRSYERLLSVSKLPDTVFRCASHQFAFILPQLENAAFVALAINRLDGVLRGDTVPDSPGEPLLPEVRMGVAVADARRDLDPGQLLLAGEKSLRQAERDNAKFALDEEPQAKTEVLDFEADFAEALHCNQLQLYYQPKVDLATGEVHDFEALLRWPRPNGEFISPEVAVELADRQGEALALFKWALYSALHQLQEWGKAGLSPGVSVNVQAQLVSHPELPVMVQDALAIWGIAGDRLTLEITESGVIEDKHEGFKNLHRIRELGVGLSIDDFGTGYSSLAYFKQIPASELKIDRHFVARMVDNEEDAEIVRISLQLAKVFGLRVVAEGIEDQAVVDALLDMGCETGQGFLFARPLPADEVLPWLQARG